MPRADANALASGRCEGRAGFTSKFSMHMCSKGEGPGQISGLGSVALDGQGNVVVADGFNDRV